MKAREDEAMASLRAKCAMQIAQSDDRFGWKLEGLGGVRNERHSWALKFEVSAISYIPFLAPSTVRRSTVSNNLGGHRELGNCSCYVSAAQNRLRLLAESLVSGWVFGGYRPCVLGLLGFDTLQRAHGGGSNFQAGFCVR